MWVHSVYIVDSNLNLKRGEVNGGLHVEYILASKAATSSCHLFGLFVNQSTHFFFQGVIPISFSKILKLQRGSWSIWVQWLHCMIFGYIYDIEICVSGWKIKNNFVGMRGSRTRCLKVLLDRRSESQKQLNPPICLIWVFTFFLLLVSIW